MFIHDPAIASAAAPAGRKHQNFVQLTGNQVAADHDDRVGLVPAENLIHAGTVGWPGGVSPPDSRRSVRDSLPSYGSCRPDHLAIGGAQAHWAKYRGHITLAALIAASAFFQGRNRRYLFLSHRNR